MRRLAVLVTLSLWFALGCCKSKTSEEQGSNPASTATFTAPISLQSKALEEKTPGFLSLRYAKGGGDFKLRMNADMTVDLVWRGPPGAKIQAGGVSATFDANGAATTTVSLQAPMFKALEGWKHHGASHLKVLFDIPIPVTVSTPGADAQDKSLALSGSNVLGWYFENTVLKNKPALAPGEGTNGAGKFYFLYYPDKKHLHIKNGEAGFKDTKLLVVSEYLGADRRDCGSYEGEKTGKVTKTSISLVRRKLTVYDRRTGKQLGTQTFKGKGGCPPRMMKSYKVHYPDSDAMDRFIERFLS